eukprot:CAMPEP_0194162918 /NCGR_PEP_ID=MMETSP0152-20130528/79758_1 /TAXON_ID=1049557 /ORGANISM="Thalassiothrix antarctica, Strain L6-D1" /LENGTH=316 /DNA_ID=CAMNT_0038872861 /DNA_START=480 /DNA_END=1427 /DNA_ORIENTATION=-
MDYVVRLEPPNRPKCPECRKEILEGEFVFVDPRLSSDNENIDAEKRSRAKESIRKAAKMLEESNGQLAPELWHQLYLAIDIPGHVSQRGNPLLSAIPKEIVTFFRAATYMSSVNNKADASPTLGHGRSSKIQALLHDIPKNERSVVFTTSLTAVKHLMAVFETCGISHSALYTRQNCSAAEHAIERWKQSRIGEDGNVKFSALVLIIQAGAAASGLTLTAACKMFFLEPFVRQEEEQQAFARCHRYGQVNSVHAKVYFSPVSVESRLLEWRKISNSHGPQDTEIVYNDIADIVEKENIDSEKKGDQFSKQTIDNPE